MSRPSVSFALLFAGAATLSACSDTPVSGPAALAGRNLAFDRSVEASAAATILRGTGDPSVDVPAVQGAVDRGGKVLLEGHFSFDATPNTQNAVSAALLTTGGFPKLAEVKITRAVSISGVGDDDGEMATVDAGTLPFYIEAPGQPVTIRRLRFRNPLSHAILVSAVQGLEISSTRVEGVRVFAPNNANGAVAIYTAAGIPSPSNARNAANVTGRIDIVDNDFDLTGGTATDNVLGITVFSVGDSTARVDVRVSGNKISHVTEPAINFRRAIGRVVIDHNIINTGTIGVTGARDQVIRVANLGTYVVAHNSIRSDWPLGDAEAIGVFSQLSPWHMQHAVVVDNDIDMAPAPGTVLGDFSAGISVYGYADSNIVRDNRIRGHARAGISIPVFPTPPASPTGNVFIRNRFIQFAPDDSDYFVGAGAVDTRIVGRGSVDDRGTGTMHVVPR